MRMSFIFNYINCVTFTQKETRKKNRLIKQQKYYLNFIMRLKKVNKIYCSLKRHILKENCLD